MKYVLLILKLKKKMPFREDPEVASLSFYFVFSFSQTLPLTQLEQTVKTLFLLLMDVIPKCLLFGFRFGLEILLFNPLECIGGFLWGEREQEPYWLILNQIVL